VLELPVPARDLSSALVVGGTLLIGTSGYGVLAGPLPEAPSHEPSALEKGSSQ
jgi:hypothetical protein